MEPVCHVEGWGGARSLVCTPHTHVHTVPTAQIHTRARTVMHMPTQHTRAHTRGDGAPPHRPHCHGVGGGNGVRQVWLQSPSPSWRRESRSASWRRWPELSLQRPVESSGKGSAGDTLGCFLVGGHMLLFGMSRKLVGSRVS